MNCIYCDTQQPDKGFYCPNCFKQNRCKYCNEELIKDAKICVFCGEEVGQKSALFNVNTIEFSETETERKFKASFTDTVGQSISDSFGMILSNKIGAKKAISSGLSPVSEKASQNKTVDTDAEVVDENQPAISSELEQVKRIFKEEGDKISLIETRLKAKSKRDYGIRLTIIFLYYKHLMGVSNVPRASLTSILDDASVEDGNLRAWLGSNPLIGINDGQVHIKAPGKDKAKEILIEMSNSELKDTWQIGTSSKAGRKSKDKKEKLN